jgi:GTPase SAR1 family protein
MSEPSAPTPATAAPVPEGVRIVLFGLPAAGKSSLLGALAQAAQSQEYLLHGHLTDVTHGLDELRHRLYDEQGRRTAEEVVPYPVDYEPFVGDGKAAAPTEHLGAILIDCDGRVANDLLVRRRSLDDDSPEGTLAREVLQADTLVLVIDASAPTTQLDADFAEFGQFLQLLEQNRGQRTEVGGLPVFLVLTKCDLLAQPNETPTTWMERIETHKREVSERFRAFLARRGPTAPAFGRIDLHLWATAVKRPALAGVPAKPREPFGVAELFRQCLEKAEDFRELQQRSERRLFWTVGAAAGLVALFIALIVGVMLLRQDNRPSALQARVDTFRFNDRLTAAERFQAPLPDLRQRLAILHELRDDPDFANLQDKDKKYVEERLAELTEYVVYLEKLTRARRPAEAKTEEALQEIKDELQTRLALPHPDWAGTEAGRLHAQLLEQADALQKAVARARNWYLENSDDAQRLWTFAGKQTGPESPAVNWRTWYADVEKALAPTRTAPFAETDRIPGAEGLTYATVLGFDRVKEARADWDKNKARLERVRNVAAALGLVEAGKEHPPVLVIPRPPGFLLERARSRLQELQKFYPNFKDEMTLDGLPDAIRGEVAQAARTNYDYLLEPGRDAVLRHLREAGAGDAETAERWAAVHNWLIDPEELAAWRVLALVLAKLHETDPVDPVSALASFLQKTSFTLDVQRLTLEVPDSLKVKPPLGATLSLFLVDPDHPALRFESSGDGKHDAQRRVTIYTFRPVEARRLTYHPGEAFWANLPLRDGYAFTWTKCRSTLYQFEKLIRPPRLHKVGQNPVEGDSAEGVRLTVSPPDGLPRVPDLLPIVPLKLGR